MKKIIDNELMCNTVHPVEGCYFGHMNDGSVEMPFSQICLITLRQSKLTAGEYFAFFSARQQVIKDIETQLPTYTFCSVY